MEKPQSHNKILIGLKGGDNREGRFSVNLPVNNKRFSPKNPASIRNLSLNGAFLETLPIREGRIIDVEFVFPGYSPGFHVLARIMWCRRTPVGAPKGDLPMGMGIKFIRFIRGKKQELKELLKNWQELHSMDASGHLRLLGPKPPSNPPEKNSYPDEVPCQFGEKEIQTTLDAFIETMIFD